MSLKLKVFKYRSLASLTLVRRVADIIRRKRVYCSELKNLNDPIEGILNYKYQDDEKRLVNVMNKVCEARIASFSLRRNIPLMWFHYADAGKGCCVELEVEEAIIDRVFYSLSHIQNTTALTDEQLKRKVLSHKFVNWSYEEEVRFIAFDSQNFIDCDVKALYIGKMCNNWKRCYLKKIAKRERIDCYDFQFLPLNGSLRESISSQEANPNRDKTMDLT